MNRQVSAMTVLAAVLLMAGAVLLITQWPTHDARALALSSPVYLAAELVFYLLLLVVLDRGLTAFGYALGAAGALGMRIALGFAAATLNYWRAGGPYDARLYPAIFSVSCVAVGAATSAVVLVLLRDVLPQRRRPVRAARSQAAGSAKPSKAEPWAKFAFDATPTPAPRRRAASEAFGVADPEYQREASTPPPPPVEAPRVFEGELELPLAALLRQAPEPLKAADGCEQAGVCLPLSLIGPQLATGRVALTAAALAELAPQGALDISGVDPAMEIALPLEAIVPALPPGTLDLGRPRPPAWLVSVETEETLFCSA